MGFASFAGRVFFASIFILSAWQIHNISKYRTGWLVLVDKAMPYSEKKMNSGIMKWFNEFGVDGGPAAKELIPKLDLAKKHISSQLHVNLPDIEVRQLVATAIILKGLGAILFVFGHGFGALLLVFRNAFIPIVLFLGICVAQCGALIFFVGMKNSMPKRQLRRKAPKRKAT
ncbi:hypothetical protein GOBAR_AA02518 [Gossypium barbadense]|uniref:Uncharacterized protein n=1 Tax=Gossypium barbadense TaxID=3634 RepID=A0A2P5YR21_GOSBA|nr:hypothetical protein GOBAR_AA02518 [Gossypium barbadense]